MEKHDILKAEIGFRIKKRRKAAGLTQIDLGRESNVNHSLISKIEAGMRFPTLISLQALMEYFNSDATTFLADLGLSKAGYEQIRSKAHIHQDIADRLRVPADTTYDINAWLGDDVVIPKQPGRPHSLPDPDELNRYISQQFTSAACWHNLPRPPAPAYSHSCSAP